MTIKVSKGKTEINGNQGFGTPGLGVGLKKRGRNAGRSAKGNHPYGRQQKYLPQLQLHNTSDPAILLLGIYL